jgi:tetratricopeptide (TPR) repeat protein
MGRIEKTVFISYRRTNIAWALAIFQNLTHHGYDVFIDYNGITSGDFERVIIENINSRAHFLVLLTPSALERCGEPGDWLRREIETALINKRNFIPLMLEGFNFRTPEIANQLTGTLTSLSQYNGLNIPSDYFDAAMERLRGFLEVPLSAVLHPASASALTAASEQKAAADAAEIVQEEELTAQQWFERGFASPDNYEKLRFYTEAILLKPNLAAAFNNRGNAQRAIGDLDGAMQDYDTAIKLRPETPQAFRGRGIVRRRKGDFEGALQDYNEAVHLKPNASHLLNERGLVFASKRDFKRAIEDYNEAIRLDPDKSEIFTNRGNAWNALGNAAEAIADYKIAQIKNS